LPETRQGPWTLLLFDIDGTLCLSGGAGARALERAIFELMGVRGALDGITLDGATDRAILRAIFAALGRAFDPELARLVLARYVQYLPHELRTGQGYRLMPGVANVLSGLSARQMTYGLCTGNLLEGARAKLDHGGIWDHFAPPHFGGGFGSDAEERHEIVRVALARAEAHLQRAIPPREALVVGDTPRDVAAALAAGVPCLGVATGRSSEADLLSAGATYSCPTLEAPSAISLLFEGRV
jgi:phosphoglycolate phosphatase